MATKIKVVTGASYGDEGKGLVSGCLAETAIGSDEKVLTVFYNGTVQRAHTTRGKILHCTGAGDLIGGSTYYHSQFVVDPIALWLTEASVYIDPRCRIILPCDVMRNRKKEIARGEKRHGSCGMGLFEAVKRSADVSLCVYAMELLYPYSLYKRVKRIQETYNDQMEHDDLYNLDNWMRAVAYVTENCQIKTFDEVYPDYDTIIYEGGQGLLLDQSNVGDFPHLTPSSVGGYNIASDIAALNLPTSIYYVSRTYMTRHGAGPMEAECEKKDINPDIVDKTNEENPWQGKLRFGYLNTDSLYNRVRQDLSQYGSEVEANMVFTQLNYTDNKLCVGNNQLIEIAKPDFIHSILGSDREDSMFKVM